MSIDTNLDEARVKADLAELMQQEVAETNRNRRYRELNTPDLTIEQEAYNAQEFPGLFSDSSPESDTQHTGEVTNSSPEAEGEPIESQLEHTRRATPSTAERDVTNENSPEGIPTSRGGGIGDPDVTSGAQGGPPASTVTGNKWKQLLGGAGNWLKGGIARLANGAAGMVGTLFQAGLTQLQNDNDARALDMRGYVQDFTIKSQMANAKREGLNTWSQTLREIAQFEADMEKHKTMTLIANYAAGLYSALGGVSAFLDPGDKPNNPIGMAARGLLGKRAQKLVQFFNPDNPDGYHKQVKDYEEKLLANYGGDSVRAHFRNPTATSAAQEILSKAIQALKKSLNAPGTTTDSLVSPTMNPPTSTPAGTLQTPPGVLSDDILDLLG